MKAGETVRVFAAGQPQAQSLARVVLVSPNFNSLVLAFDDKPVFGTQGRGFTVHPELGLVLVLLRDAETIPFWRDIFTGGRYGIVVGKAE